MFDIQRKMDNPYSPPVADPVPTSVTKGRDSKMSKVMRGIVAMACIFALMAFVFFALIMLTQAFDWSSEAPRLSHQAQPSHYTIARALWIAGGTALISAVLNIVALVLLFRRRLAVPALLLAFSVVFMVVVAILFKPA